MGEKQRLPTVVGVMVIAVVLVLAIAVVGGGVAALFGGSLSDLGEGYGGLWGAPATVLTLVALVLGTFTAIKISRDLGPGSGRLRIALLVVIGVWIVAVGYGEVAHQLDPCARGWWDTRSQIGSQPLCERFGSELNWNTRFHLLAHAAPAALLLGIYLLAIRRWGRPRTVVQSDQLASAAATTGGDADITR